MSTTVAMTAMPKLLERHDAKAREACAKGLRSAARFARTHLVKVTPKDRGMAKAAWKEHYGPANARPPTPAAWVENSAPYIGVLEMGARPHKVSIEGRQAIYEWVLRNFRMVGGTQTGYAAEHGNTLHPGQRRRAIKSVSGGETVAKRITYFICKKIEREGAKPRYFVRDSLDLLRDVALREAERCLREVAEKGGR
jgi:hypothetical protein